MKHTWRLKDYTLIVVAFLLVTLEGTAQMRSRPDAGGVAGGVVSPIRLRELSGNGKRGLVRTPEYTTSISRGKNAARTWAEILIQFDFPGERPNSTEPEWIDELSFQFYVLMHDSKAKEYTFLKGIVAHTDVAKGRGHYSAMYVRPSGLERFGDVVAVAVEAVIKGATVGVMSEGKLPQGQALPTEWWKTTKLIPKDGYLLNRAQTPFVFVNYDDYEVVK